MINGDVIFCATGVTSGDLATGVKDLGNEYEVNTFVLHKSQNIIKSVTNIYNKNPSIVSPITYEINANQNENSESNIIYCYFFSVVVVLHVLK